MSIQIAEATVPPTSVQPTRLICLARGGSYNKYQDIATIGSVAIGIENPVTVSPTTAIDSVTITAHGSALD